MLTKRPCCICRRWFVPDRRVGRRQRACSAPTCQTARRARTQASWRRRNPDYFIAHRMQRRRVEAEEAKGAVLPLDLPPPLSQLPWDVAQEAFGVTGTEFPLRGKTLASHRAARVDCRPARCDPISRPAPIAHRVASARTFRRFRR